MQMRMKELQNGAGRFLLMVGILLHHQRMRQRTHPLARLCLPKLPPIALHELHAPDDSLR